MDHDHSRTSSKRLMDFNCVHTYYMVYSIQYQGLTLRLASWTRSQQNWFKGTSVFQLYAYILYGVNNGTFSSGQLPTVSTGTTGLLNKMLNVKPKRRKHICLLILQQY